MNCRQEKLKILSITVGKKEYDTLKCRKFILKMIFAGLFVLFALFFGRRV